MSILTWANSLTAENLESIYGSTSPCKILFESTSGWSLEPLKSSEVTLEEVELAARLLTQAPVGDDQSQEGLIQVVRRVNHAWMQLRLYPMAYDDEAEEAIPFLSDVKGPYKTFSNFTNTLVVAKDITTQITRIYPSSEAAFVAMKLSFFGESVEKFAQEFDSRKVKLHSRKILKKYQKTPIPPEAKIVMMCAAVKAKFDCNPILKGYLAGTRSRILIEDTIDDFWGAGADGQGDNHLGKILMAYRLAFC
jgi:ribA/ribD-fused uncharacterized protein